MKIGKYQFFTETQIYKEYLIRADSTGLLVFRADPFLWWRLERVDWFEIGRNFDFLEVDKLNFQSKLKKMLHISLNLHNWSCSEISKLTVNDSEGKNDSPRRDFKPSTQVFTVVAFSATSVMVCDSPSATLCWIANTWKDLSAANKLLLPKSSRSSCACALLLCQWQPLFQPLGRPWACF